MEKSIYELTLITDQKASEKKAKELVESVLAKVDGRLVDFNFWGKRDLVYPIKKQTTVCFSFSEVELAKDKVGELKNRLGINDDVWRSMIVKATEIKKVINQKKK